MDSWRKVVSVVIRFNEIDMHWQIENLLVLAMYKQLFHWNTIFQISPLYPINNQDSDCWYYANRDFCWSE